MEGQVCSFLRADHSACRPARLRDTIGVGVEAEAVEAESVDTAPDNSPVPFRRACDQ